MKLLYQQLRVLTQPLPQPFRKILKFLAPSWLRARYDPLQNPDYHWPLKGVLSGYVFTAAVEKQYVLSDYEPVICAAIQRNVQSGMICVDVGANIGYLSLLMAHCCGPTGKVYAFEPLPDNLEQLKKNIAINHLLDQVIIEGLAVSDKSSSQVDFYEGDSTFEFSLLPRHGHTTRIEVQTIALDDYFTEQKQLDFVKIDVEGAEGRVIAGMQRILLNQRPICLVEIHHGLEATILDQLLEAEYSLFDLEDRPVNTSIRPVMLSHILAKPNEYIINLKNEAKIR